MFLDTLGCAIFQLCAEPTTTMTTTTVPDTTIILTTFAATTQTTTTYQTRSISNFHELCTFGGFAKCNFTAGTGEDGIATVKGSLDIWYWTDCRGPARGNIGEYGIEITGHLAGNSQTPFFKRVQTSVQNHIILKRTNLRTFDTFLII